MNLSRWIERAERVPTTPTWRWRGLPLKPVKYVITRSEQLHRTHGWRPQTIFWNTSNSRLTSSKYLMKYVRSSYKLPYPDVVSFKSKVVFYVSYPLSSPKTPPYTKSKYFCSQNGFPVEKGGQSSLKKVEHNQLATPQAKHRPPPTTS